MKTVKEYVFRTAAAQLQGYKYLKSRGSFKKTIGDNTIEVAFGFLDYSPLDYQYHFCIIIYIGKIEEALKDFYAHSGVDENANWAAAFFEGDFLEEIKDAEYKWRTNYYNKVTSFEDLEQKLKQTLSLLEEKALPFVTSISNLESFASYYFHNPDQIVRNFASTTLFCSSLLGTYLNDRKAYYNLAAYLKEELDRQAEKGNADTLLYSYLEKLNKFVEDRLGNVSIWVVPDETQ
jgi:hypothetical protein